MRLLKSYEVNLLFAGGLYLLTLLVYSNAFNGPFVYEDFSNILDNPALRMSVIDAEKLFQAGFSSDSPHGSLADISFALNYYLGDYRVFGFHLVNVLIHTANGLLIYFLVLAIGRTQDGGESFWRWVAFLSGLFFLVHPLQTQAISYISQRSTILTGFFYLVSLLLYVLGRRSFVPATRFALWCGAGVAGISAFATNAMALSLLLVLFVWEWCFGRGESATFLRRTLLSVLLFGSVLASLAVLSFGPAPAGFDTYEYTIWQRFMTECQVVTIYLGLALWPDPARLNLLHEVSVSQGWLSPIGAAIGLIVVIGLGVASLRVKRNCPVIAFALCWLLLHLAFAFPFDGKRLVAEHRMYLPMVGFSVALGYVLVWICTRMRAVGIAVVIGIFVCLSSATYLRNAIWQDRLTLWVDVVSKNPNDPIGLNYLGLALLDKGHYAKAQTQFTEALFQQPDYAEAYNNLGVLMASEGRYSEGLHYFRQAVAVSPEYARARHNLGHTFSLLGRDADAIEALRGALNVNPNYDQAHVALANVLLKVGEFTAACEHLKAAHRLAPRDQRIEAAIAQCLPAN
mgnify:CR=1 FL=1